MLQGTAAVRKLQPTWRPLLGALRRQSTQTTAPKATGPKEAEKKEQTSARTPLSARLGGSGRGKPLATVTDPFSQFLNAKGNEKQRSNNDRPRRQQNRPRKQAATAAPGQFEDAPEKRKEGDNAGRRQQRPRDNNKNNNINRRNERAPRREVKTQARRAVTFIDKDIDWAALHTTMNVHEEASLEGQEDSEQLVRDMQGDYDRYVSVAEGVQLSALSNAEALGTLVGNNATYDIQQKATFLATVSRVTGSSAQARK
ncbi:hypothetical protein EC973_000149 [Apophysomyces ossiformis]|uniref:Uncharacterized protein n=1 Tax=Apophysomyces ossiformis TaxID=679940 RepID=A0A8H7C0Z4_9FUNG|nr:hypothetical protein EC973_000149 [Apophysomyces ossiformis]